MDFSLQALTILTQLFLFSIGAVLIAVVVMYVMDVTQTPPGP